MQPSLSRHPLALLAPALLWATGAAAAPAKTQGGGGGATSAVVLEALPPLPDRESVYRVSVQPPAESGARCMARSEELEIDLRSGSGQLPASGGGPIEISCTHLDSMGQVRPGSGARALTISIEAP